MINKHVIGYGLAGLITLGSIGSCWFKRDSSPQRTSGIYTLPETPRVLKDIKLPDGVANPTAVLGTWNNEPNILVSMDGTPMNRLRIDANRNPVGYDRIGDEIIYNKRTGKFHLSYIEELVQKNR